MPAPPRKGEKEKAFISRCVSYLVKKEGKSQDQAVAQCYSMWRKEHGGKKPSKSTGYKTAEGI